MIHRHLPKTGNFTLVDNQYLLDDRLSWKAKGILTYLLSRPDSWEVYLIELEDRSRDGLRSARAGLAELRKFGYLVGQDAYERPCQNSTLTMPKQHGESCQNSTLIILNKDNTNAALAAKAPGANNAELGGMDAGTLASQPILGPPEENKPTSKGGIARLETPPSPQVPRTPLPKPIARVKQITRTADGITVVVEGIEGASFPIGDTSYQNRQNILDSGGLSSNIQQHDAHRELAEYFRDAWATEHRGVKCPLSSCKDIEAKKLLDLVDWDLAWAKRIVTKYLKNQEPFFDGHPLWKLVRFPEKFMVATAPTKRADPAKPSLECQE